MKELALGVYLACFAADGITTHQGFALTKYPTVTVREIYMTSSPAANDAILAAQAGGLLWATGKLKNPYAKWGVRFGIASLHAYAAVHNRRQINAIERWASDKGLRHTR